MKQAADEWTLKNATSMLRRHFKRLRGQNWNYNYSFLNPCANNTNVWKKIDILRESRKPSKPFKCIPLALGLFLMDSLTAVDSYDMSEGGALDTPFSAQKFEATVRI